MDRRQDHPRRLLLLTYHFPPNWEVGARRPYALARLLPQHGWQVTVLTVRAPDEVFVDATRPVILPPSTRVHRTPSLELTRVLRRLRGGGWNGAPGAGPRPAAHGPTSRKPVFRLLRKFLYNWVYVPDKRVGWIPFAVRAALREVRRSRPHVLLTTSPPHSLQIAGYLIARATGLKWVVDFRDLWTQNTLNTRTDLPQRLAFERWLETQVLFRADRIVTTSVGSRDLLRKRLPPPRRSRVRSIPNGYDGETVPAPDSGNGVFRLAITGRAYPDTLRPILAGLQQAVSLEPALRGRLRLTLLGHVDDRVPLGEAFSAGITVERIPYAHPTRAAQLQAASDLLVCAIPNGPYAEAWMPYKLIEYFARRKPILFVGPRGEAWNALRASQLGWAAEPDDVDAIASAVLAAYRRRNDGRAAFEGPEDFLYEWSAEHRVAQFAELLEELLRD